LEPPAGAKVGERFKVEGGGDPTPDEVLKSKTAAKVLALCGLRVAIWGEVPV
jgi:hypothetical protein